MIALLKHWQASERPEKAVLDARLDKARAGLYELQLKIKEAKLPVLVLLEGWSAAGKGSVIGRLIKNIDPRFFRVAAMARPTEEDLRRPFLYRFMKDIPGAGSFAFYDGGWIEQTTTEFLRGQLDEQDYAARLESIQRFERQLTDNGYLVMKFFLHIDREEQERRLDALRADKDTAWRATDFDLWQNTHYKKCRKVFDHALAMTNTPAAPWYILDASDPKWTELQALETLVQGIHVALQNQAKSVPLLPNTFPLVTTPLLSQVTLEGKTLEEEAYRRQLKALQKQLGELHNRLYRRRVPVVIAYEGWDAAGKGGNIKRLTEALDPRGYEVHPIASPEPYAKARHYLWRFWTRLPKDGHIAIFDRTWYGRVMVERLEGFCSENDWQRAYHEINEFERELTDWGAVVIKFWVQIDKQTQLLRFNERQNDPAKQWKITEEDWRNREKWDAYETAVNEMLQKTSTANAPWHILESVDKKYARIKALQITADTLEKALR